MTAAGTRAALRAGVAGVIAKSINEHPAAARQLDHPDDARLDPNGRPTAGGGVCLFNRSGLIERDAAEWFAAIRLADGLARYADPPETPGRWRDFVPLETLDGTCLQA